MTRDHMTLDRFYPIFDHPQWLGRMLPYGIKLVQMRIKDENEANLASLLQDSLAQCRSHACTMVVNDYWRIAIDIGADYVATQLGCLQTEHFAKSTGSTSDNDDFAIYIISHNLCPQGMIFWSSTLPMRSRW